MSKIKDSGFGEHLREPAGFRYKFLDSSAILFGCGTSTSGERATTATADKNFATFYTQSTATSGTSRGIYWRHYIGGAAEGETARFFTVVATAGVPGGVHGAHISAELDDTATSQVTGLMCGVRATWGALAATRTVTGTICALQVDTNIDTGNTVPASHAFIRVSNNGTVAFTNLFDIPTSTVTRKGSAPSASNGLAIRLDGALAYIMVGT